MKKITQIVVAGIFSALVSPLHAQTWCTPPTCSPFPCAGINSYSNSSPVITNVTFNTINRSSTPSQKELYVNTGASTNVTKGQSYNFSMTYTMDPSICTIYKVRVWIDWNLNYAFDAGTEEILSSDASSTGTLSGSILVPASAATGTTRMRVAMKMDGCGHTLPDPCLVTDGSSLGWHGEVEDYTLNVTGATSILDYSVLNNVNIFPNPAQSFITVDADAGIILKNAEFIVYDAVGKEAAKIFVPDGSTTFAFSAENLPAGMYSYKLFSEKEVTGAGKFVIER